MTDKDFEDGLVSILAASFELVHDVLAPHSSEIAGMKELKQAVIAVFQILPKSPEHLKKLMEEE